MEEKTIVEAMKILKNWIYDVGDSDIMFSHDGFGIHVLKTGIQLVRIDEDGDCTEEMFLEVRR